MKTLRSMLAGILLCACAVSGCSAGNHDAATAKRAPTSTASRLPGTGKPPVTIGDKNFTEQFLLGELYGQALTAQGYAVQLNRDIGPTEVTMRAIYSGRLDMYPEYLGTWDTNVAGVRRSFRTLEGAYTAARRFARLHGLAMLSPTPFSDTGAVAVSVAYSRAHHLKTIADLRRVAPAMTFGASPEFQQSATGLSALEQTYGFVPASVSSLPIGGQYQALDQGQVQAAQVNTTDGQLQSGKYRVLRDPARTFGWGQAVPVVPLRVLQSEGPAFARTIEIVTGLLTTRSMRQLNAAVDVYGRDPAVVARQFLQAHGLVPLPSS